MALKLVKILISVGYSSVAQFVAIQYAYMERGYKAVGGEIFVFPLCMVACLWIFGFFRTESNFFCYHRDEDDDFYDGDIDQWVS